MDEPKKDQANTSKMWVITAVAFAAVFFLGFAISVILRL
jgi:preprotein translocase subunit SecE